MLTILNQTLPVYFMLLPLGIAALLAAKYYQSQSKLQKQKQKHDIAFELQKMKIDELMQQCKDLNEAIESRKETQSLAKDIIKDLTEKCHKLESDAVEREAHITELNKLIENLKHLSDVRVQSYKNEIEQLKSKLQLSELAHNETKADNEGLEIQFKDALSVINRTGRAKKQWDKICKEKAIKLLNTTIEAVKQKQSETVVHDALGVARVFQADQSESVNNRHIKELSNEVVRGIAQQNEAIKKELGSVDMSTLQVGDTVKFLNGTFDTVDRINKCNGDWDYRVYFSDGTVGTYMSDGSFRISSTLNLKQWSIIQIIKPAKQEVKFHPQVDEIVRLADFQQESFKILEIRDDMYFVEHTSKGWKQYRSLGKLLPIAHHEYKNGFIQK